MSPDTAPTETTAQREVLMRLMEIGANFAEALDAERHKPGANIPALAAAFTTIARDVRRAILLANTLDQLRAPQLYAPQPRSRAVRSGEPATERPEPKDRLDTLDRPDRLDSLDRLPNRPPAEVAATIQRDMTAAACALDALPPLNRHQRRLAQKQAQKLLRGRTGRAAAPHHPTPS